MGFGFVVARFGLYLAEIHGGAAPSDRFSLWSGTAFIAVGVAVNLLSTRRHLRVVEAHRALMASPWSTGMTVTANGVPASSDTKGSWPPNSLPPSIEFT
jgi:hypothetical protein